MVPNYTLYLVTDEPEAYPEGLLAGVEAAVDAGATLVQYRATTGTRRTLYETARALRRLLGPRGIPFVVNDYLDLALAVDADGLHLGQDDLPVSVARRLLSKGKLLGLSITKPDQLARVDPQKVDYLGVGPVFTTSTKADAAEALGLDALAQIVRASPLPIVAIGGISRANAAAVRATGVAGIAVVSAVSRAHDPAAAISQLRAVSD